MLHRQFFVYFSFIPLIVSVSYLEILRFLSATEIYIKHILSIWCFIHKIHDHVEIVHLSAPLDGKDMAAVHFPHNALQSKIFKKANGCPLKDRSKAGG